MGNPNEALCNGNVDLVIECGTRRGGMGLLDGTIFDFPGKVSQAVAGTRAASGSVKDARCAVTTPEQWSGAGNSPTSRPSSSDGALHGDGHLA